ncbi:MAG: hypothetical protein U9Q81_23815 [Pseudomonadota bacterium]|nr:hypothetical protein [Pseudomonadota bacterium]
MSGQGVPGRILASLVYWVAALALAAALFYGLDHGVMAMQGLPLNWDLSPAQ